MADMNCRPGLEEGKTLTVGERLTWACEPTAPNSVNIDLAKAELRLEEADKYKLKLLGAQKGENGTILLDTTTYVVGDHTLKAVQLVDPTSSALLGDLRFTVTSVQDPKQPVQEPYGPMGPMRFFPILFFALILVAIVLFLIPVILGWITRRRRRKLMETLDAQSFQYAPFPEFHRVLRGLQREHLFLADPRSDSAEPEKLKAFGTMKDSFRVYLSRQFRVPAFKWNAVGVVKTLLRETKLKENAIKEVAVTLRELERAEKDPAKLTPMDLHQLLKMMKNTSEVVEKEVPRG